MRALNAQGYGVVPRSWILDPPPVSSDMIDPAAAGVVVVAVGLAALEIILLAGAAFAVGARRRTRELGVLQATGADRGDVVRVVLGGGVVLGLVAGLVGILGGIAAVFLLRPRLDEVNGALLGPLDLRPLELAAIVGVAVGTAVLAALLPARAASRTAVVAALTGRRGQVRTPRRVPALGLLAIVVGGLVAFWAAGSGIVPVSQSAGPGGGVTPAGRPAHFNLLLLGAVVAELGFVTCAPALVGLVGRLAHRMPLALRLALRDAARHRTRSGPAVAAVVAAVAGSIAVSVYIASDTDRQRRSYQASLPLGVVEVQESDYNGEQLSAADRAAVLAALPAREEIAVGTPWCRESPTPCHQWSYELPEARKCPDYTDPGSDPRCRRFLSYGSLAVAGPELVTAITGRADRAVSDAMAAGHAIVFDDAYVENGMVVVTTEMYADPSRPPGPPVKVDAARPVPTTASQAPTPAPSRAQPRVRRQRVPAIAVTAPTFGMRPGIVIPPALARTIGLPAKRTSTWLTTTRLPTDDEIERARGAARNSSISVYAERGFQGQSGLALLALLGATTLVTLGATGIATGLAAADSRPDLATLAAVGAAPRVRRVLAMAQAATVAGLGSALGVLAGLVPAVAVIAARSEFDLVLPWPALGATIVGVPLVAALLVGAVSRSRLPLERRMA
jgi:putative ABC transport system permease protein